MPRRKGISIREDLPRDHRAKHRLHPEGDATAPAPYQHDDDSGQDDDGDYGMTGDNIDDDVGMDDVLLGDADVMDEDDRLEDDPEQPYLSDSDESLGLGMLDLENPDEEIDHDLLPAGFDSRELDAARDYNDAVDDTSSVGAVAAFDEDSEDIRPSTSASLEGPVTAPVPLSRYNPMPDPTILVPHRQNKFEHLTRLDLAMGAFAHLFGIDRTTYAAMREAIVFGLTSEDGDNSHLSDLTRLPSQLATLKARVSRRLPLLDMRKGEVPLNVSKLPTERATRKEEERAKAGKTAITADLHIIDPVSLFVTLMSSDLADAVHQGMAHFVDNPSELYHSHAWASSIRTTSGKFAHVVDGDGNWVDVVFPSDFVAYCCTDTTCVCQEATADQLQMAHMGRVYGVGLDFRSEHCTTERGEVALQIEEAFGPFGRRPNGLIPAHPGRKIANFQQSDDELILNTDLVYITEYHLIKRVPSKNIAVDYYTGEDMADPSGPAPNDSAKARKEKASKPKYTHRPQAPKSRYTVRRAFVDGGIIPMCHTHPIRAELELEVYGRKVFVDVWDKQKVICCPLLVFIDGFGVYRNSYRSLIGVYLMLAGLNSKDRLRRTNIFPMTLSPHGSNFDDTVRALQSLGTVDGGIMTTINGEDVVLCVPTLSYIGDMPQQDKNAGFRGPKANKPCRFCMIGQAAIKSGKPSDILDFDVIAHGRYHHQTMEMRAEMDSQKTATETKSYATQWGLGERPALAALTPALDLILSRPPDPAHSEYLGLTELLHELLISAILTESGRQAYVRILRTWPFPPGWERLQSPLHHLKSYSLAAHARWSIVIPTLLRGWLTKQHVHKHFLAQGRRSIQGADEDVVDFIVESYAILAKSNSVLMGSNLSSEDRLNIDGIVRRVRERYQQLCTIASQSIIDNPRAYSRFSASAAPSRQPSVFAGPSRQPSVSVFAGPSRQSSMMPPGRQQPIMPPGRPQASRVADLPLPSVEEEPGEGVQAPPKRAAQLKHDMTRPNVHLGVHYAMIANEYALPVNVNVLLGEDQHREFKELVYQTNHSNVEKTLLIKINHQVTMRMVLRKGFYFKDPELTSDMLKMYDACPTLFASVLPRTDRRDMAADEEFDAELDVHWGGDKDHRRATVIGQLTAKDRDVQHPVNSGQSLPVKHAHMSDSFKHLLRRAYVDHYHEPEIYQFPNRLQYANKVAFTDRNFERYVFTRGHHVRTTLNDQIARLDHIFIHDYDDKRFIFAVLTPVRILDQKDPLLDLHQIYYDTEQPMIVGINQIQPEKLYVVPVKDHLTVLVDWQVEWL